MKARIVELSDGRYRCEVNEGGYGVAPWRSYGLGDNPSFDPKDLPTWQVIVDEINSPPPTVVCVVYP